MDLMLISMIIVFGMGALMGLLALIEIVRRK